ncbi:outer membrane protein [Roseibium algae]|uniref:Outer membrane beta-barrel protein n=1 Tax=Roseibium algae TaxID=3123038 RepID=A0ABU8TLW6_9HYPH
MKSLLFATAVIFGSLTHSALSAEDNLAYTSGFYAGAQAGFGSLNGKDTLGGSQTLESGVFGLFGGYDHAFGNIIVGLGAEANLTNYRTLNASGSSRSSDKWNASGTVRIGYAIDRFLPYISAGVALSEYSVKRTSTGETASNTHAGYVLGAGLEAKVTNNWSARLDYKHFEMGTETYQFNGFSPFDISGHQDAVTLGVAYHF